ncbi:MAG TPA: IS66 family transposase [Luteimonas sp.]|nr:IS66 family transposase [Luteimonas sp.]
MKPTIEAVDQQELETILEHARAALSAEEYTRLKAAFDTLVYLTQLVENKRTTIARLRQILFGASTEKTAQVLKAVGTALKPEGESAPPSATGDPDTAPSREGHGRNGAQAYAGAAQIQVDHPCLKSGELCPECRRGKLYETAAPGVLVRVVGQAPLAATVYELEKLRCNLCLEVFTAAPPEGVGSQKYDAGAASMIALLKYGSGVPFHRLDGLQQSLGIPLPAATQWEIAAKTAGLVKPAFEELIRQAAQGEVLHNDDTTMTILAQKGAAASSAACAEQPETGRSERNGIFTSGIVSTRAGRTVALFFTGRKHAGENLACVLAHRAEALGPPIQMCDALSRNLTWPLKTIVAHCTAHARRKYVDVAPHFPEACQFVLETLAKVYKNDARCRESRSSPEERLRFHQTHSDPLMKLLENWLAEQFALRKVEPNSGLGQAITYMRKHWQALTLFLRKAGAPLDNNVCEQALKRAILHRKNALFYKTTNGAQVGDTFMSLIHTCGLVGANPFDYLTALQTHAAALSQSPAQWMPWNYRETLAHIDAA